MRRSPAQASISLALSIFVAFCYCDTSFSADDATPIKSITPDSIPNKIKAIENGDGTLKPKSSSAASKAGTKPTMSDKETLSQDELAERIAKKIAELHKENERVKAQSQVHKTTAQVNPMGAPRNANLTANSTMMPRDIRWSYEGEGGPTRWGKIDPANSKCDTGERQSPIDIRDGIRVDLEPVMFDYKPVRFNVVDNSHTIQVNLGAGNSITLLGRRYDLMQFHFHKPSEEHVNGVGYDMVVHLVHKDMDGKLVELAVLVQQGKANSLVQTIWNYMPLEKNDTVQPPGTIDLNQILPVNRQYYTYMGSLTTPPCTENVLWIVFKEPIELSQDQISIFSRMYSMNARPIQNSPGRLIKESN